MNKSKRILSFAVMVVMLVSLLIPALSFADPKVGNGNSNGNGNGNAYGLYKVEKFKFIDGDKIKFNGQNVKFDVDPANKGGRTLIPVRALENMGAVVSWDEKTFVVTVSNEEDTIYIFMDLKDGTVYVYENPNPNPGFKDDTISRPTFNYVKTQVDPQMLPDGRPGLINNRTFVPLRFIAETFGLRVDYDNETGNIDVVQQPKLDPSKLTYTTESSVTTDAAIKVVLKSGYTFEEIKDSEGDVLPANAYDYDEDTTTVTLNKNFILSLKTEITKLTFVFENINNDQIEKELTIKLLYNAIKLPTLSEKFAEFDNTGDISVTMYPNDYTLSSIKFTNGSSVDYDELANNIIRFDQDYLLNKLTGDTTIRFEFTKFGQDDVKIDFTINLK